MKSFITTNYDANLNMHDVSHVHIVCRGGHSCKNISISNVDSVIVSGLEGLKFGIISDITGMVRCEAAYACLNAKITNARLVVCTEVLSCQQAIIENVYTVIGVGYQSLSDAQVINATNILLLSYHAGYKLNISAAYNIADGKIYCQNSGCSNTMNIDVDEYCKDTTYIDIETPILTDENIIEMVKFYGDNITGLQLCTFVSESPTKQPTKSPTQTQLYHDFQKLLDWLDDATIIVAIVLACIAIVLMLLSIKMRNIQHEDTIEMYDMMNNTMYDDESNYNDNDNIGDIIDVDDDGYNYRFKKQSVRIRHRKQTDVLNYIHGWGSSASHFVILQLFFQIYDMFTDISYLILTLSDGHYISFGIFLTSSCLTVIVNTVFIVLFIKNAFSSTKFRIWFYEWSGSVIGLTFLCILTDMSVYVSLFTSQIFGYSLFYAPFGMNSINAMQTATMVSFICEHLPQLAVQTWVIFFEDESFSKVAAATLFVSIIDAGFVVVKGCIWLVAFRESKNHQKNGNESSDTREILQHDHGHDNMSNYNVLKVND